LTTRETRTRPFKETAMAFHQNAKKVWKSCRVELPDRPDPHWVLAVETDLVLDPAAPNYDAAALRSFADAVEIERKKLGMEKAEIWPI
jgi:hypothetical protein